MKTRFTFTWPLLVGAALLQLNSAVAADGFKFSDKKGEHLDILMGDRTVGRYMYAHDVSTGEKKNATYKPYLHVFDAEGQAPITKGVGGDFTHHRGIFIGWNKISHGGKSYDRWHMTGGQQVHQKFVAQEADAERATITSLVNWNDAANQPIIVEERTMTFRRAPAPAYVLIDFSTKLKAPNGDVVLDGDPEHAGIQFRPANEVDRKQSVYLFPKEAAVPNKDLDYPWVGQTFSLSNKLYSVVDLNHPANPKGTRWSAYRNYGRFGTFPKAPIKTGETLLLQYRFVVAEGAMPSAETIQKWFNEFAGTTDPVPKTTLRKADQPAPPKDAAKPAAPK